MGQGAATAKASTFLEGKDERLEVLSERPLVLSTPPGLLSGTRITPTDRIFVRNIQDLPGSQTLDVAVTQGWEIELVGLIEPLRLVFQAEKLLVRELVYYDMVFVCL